METAGFFFETVLADCLDCGCYRKMRNITDDLLLCLELKKMFYFNR